MSELNRTEIVFLYDVMYANPNGDPMEENRPRIDEETSINIVTDVRLKRTIRDYFLTLIGNGDERLKGQDVFIKEVRDSEGYLYDAKTRAKDFLREEEETFSEIKEKLKDEICSKCIDIRLFGGVIPLEFKISNKTEKGSITLTGPVQFKFGRSLHRVEVKYIQGTGAFASDYSETKKSTQFTFREEYVLPYSLICFYGIINENAARTTKLTENDINLLLEGVWDGTKNLITRSKAGQVPRFLLKVVYKETNFHRGDLDKMIKLVSEGEEEKIRDISEVKLDISELVSTLKEYKEKIHRIELKVDNRAIFTTNGQDFTSNELKTKLKEIGLQENQIGELNF